MWVIQFFASFSVPRCLAMFPSLMHLQVSRGYRFVITFVTLNQNLETLATKFRFDIACSSANSPTPLVYQFSVKTLLELEKPDRLSKILHLVTVFIYSNRAQKNTTAQLTITCLESSLTLTWLWRAHHHCSHPNANKSISSQFR